jgi:hypothetical protein
MTLNIKTSATIAYKDIFSTDDKPNVDDLLADIPSKSILTIVAHFMAQIHSREDEFMLHKEIFLRWINQQNDEIRKELTDKFDEIAEKHNENVNFFNNITSLYFYQVVFSNYHDGDDRHLSAEEELRLIKAYLLVSEKWTEKEIEHLSQRPQNDAEMVAYVLPFQMTHNEIQCYKDFRPQIFKALHFFQFIEQDEILKEHLPDFLAQYGLNNWKEYLKHTIVPYVISLSGSRSTVLVFKEENKLETDYWDTFCIEVEGYLAKADFLELRENPVFKLQPLHYLYFNYNFIIDKLFQALQFVFSKLLIEKGVVSDFGDFKSKFYSETFSENYLLYKTIEHCIANQTNIVSLNGEELAEKLGEKGPDYYIRVNNHILLIEFKDVLMGAGPKVSYDFDKISAEINKKLVQNEKGKAKGVGQLSKFINNIPDKGYDFDEVEEDNLIFYPLLLVTDSAFNLFGINYLLENEFRAQLQENNKREVKHLSLLHFDTLLMFQDLFNENRVNFFDLLVGYDYNQKQGNYKFQNLGTYFIDYINHHRIPSRDMPDELRKFITEDLVDNK